MFPRCCHLKSRSSFSWSKVTISFNLIQRPAICVGWVLRLPPFGSTLNGCNFNGLNQTLERRILPISRHNRRRSKLCQLMLKAPFVTLLGLFPVKNNGVLPFEHKRAFRKPIAFVAVHPAITRQKVPKIVAVPKAEWNHVTCPSSPASLRCRTPAFRPQSPLHLSL